MAEQTTKQHPKSKQEGSKAVKAKDLGEKKKSLNENLDSLIEDIDAVLEDALKDTTAEEWVSGYVQRGGQ